MLFHTILALAAQTAVADDPQAAPKKADKQICRTERTTTSRIGSKRVCRTQMEWEDQAKRSVDALDKQRNDRR